MSNNNRIKHLTLLSFFVGIELLLALTPLGMVQIGPLALTLMHIPVIVAGMKLGWKDGLLLGGLMGLTSLLKATFTPTITSFVFSPFISVGGISGNAWSLLIAFGPRLLLGLLAAILPLKNKGLVAGLVTLVHTALVLGLIVVCFAPAYSTALHLTGNGLMIALGSVIVTNALPECLLAVLVCGALQKGKLI